MKQMFSLLRMRRLLNLQDVWENADVKRGSASVAKSYHKAVRFLRKNS